MIKTYMDFARWVWELPDGDQVVLDEMPKGSNGQPMTIEKIRDMIFQVNKRSPAICLTLLSPSVENGYRPTLRRYEGWQESVSAIIEGYKTPLADELSEVFRRVQRPLIDDMDDASVVIEDGDINYIRVIASRWNQKHPKQTVTVSKIPAGVLIDANRNKMTSRAYYEAQFADITERGIPIRMGEIGYVRVILSEWNSGKTDKLTTIRKDGQYWVFPRSGVTRMIDIIRDCGVIPDGKVAYARASASRWNTMNPNDRRSVICSDGKYVICRVNSGGSDFHADAERDGVAVVALNKRLRSTKSVQVVHYDEQTVGYRRDADMLLRRWKWEKNGDAGCD